MGHYGDVAKSYFESGYSCCQSVMLTFAEKLGLDPVIAKKMSAPLGGGMGRMREVCGALSGMFLTLGLTESYAPGDDVSKASQYAEVQMLAARFRERNGDIICRKLLGLEDGSDAPTPSQRTETYYKERPCGKFVYDAADILGEYLREKGIL